MKKCETCGKEITYFEQYCSDECQKEAIKFYEFKEKYEKIFSILNCICIFAIPVGIFLSSILREIGLTMVCVATVALGLLVILLPFPADNMLDKFKLNKAIKYTRIIGVVILLLGIIGTVLFLMNII